MKPIILLTAVALVLSPCVDACLAMTIPATKLLSDGSSVSITSATVTYSGVGFFYIEENTRIAGIRVESTSPFVIAKEKVDVTGTIQTNAFGERYVAAALVVEGQPDEIKPVGMATKLLGGGGWSWTEGNTEGQRGIEGGFGLNNIGLLASVVGKITYSCTSCFYLDDGCGLEDGSGNRGVRVLSTDRDNPSVGECVEVDGIISCSMLNGEIRPVILPTAFRFPLVDHSMSYVRIVSRRTDAVGGSAASPLLLTTGSNVPNTNNYMGVLRYGMPVAANCRSLRVTYGNYSAMGVNSNPVAVRAALDVGGTVYPLFFRGQREVVLGDAVVQTDPLDVSVPAGTTVWVRTYYDVGEAGKKLPQNGTCTVNYDMAYFSDSATRADAVNWKTDLLAVLDAPTFPTNRGFPSGYSPVFAPIAVLGIVEPTQKAVAVMGDSITAGGGDNNFYRERGFVCRTLGAAGMPYVNLAVIGEQSDTFIGDPRRHSLLRNCTHAIVAYGVNDIRSNRSLAVIQGNLLALWTDLQKRGLKVWACTVTPVVKNDSTGQDYLSVSDQEIDASSHPDVLDALNAWIRTCPAPLTGVFDTAAEVTTRNGGGLPVWKVWENPVCSLDYQNIRYAWGGTWADCANVTSFNHSGLGIAFSPQPSPWPWQTLFKFNDGDYYKLNWEQYSQGQYSIGISAPISVAPTGQIHFYDAYTQDGVHPTTSGHMAMSRGIHPEQLQ